VSVDAWGPIFLNARDALVVCSDGLHGQVTDDEIASIVGANSDAAAEHLVALSNERGGPDNISVVICHFS